MPSAPQKRACANGRSREMHNTSVSSSPAAASLNLRTEAAHVPVSRLGKIFSTSFLALKSAKLTLDKSVFTSVKSLAFSPFSGSSPTVLTVSPFNVTLVIIVIILILLKQTLSIPESLTAFGNIFALFLFGKTNRYLIVISRENEDIDFYLNPKFFQSAKSFYF